MKKFFTLFFLFVSAITLGKFLVIDFKDGEVLKFYLEGIGIINFEENPGEFSLISSMRQGNKDISDIMVVGNDIVEFICKNGYSWT
jgi:hypothetical protein